jgi:hypothetical protein
VYTPIPNECGNTLCDGTENKCTCAQDCGKCEGKSGKYLAQQCNAQQQCVEDIPETAQKPITQTRELTASGARIGVTTTFNQPFNLKKDQVELEFSLNALAQGMSDVKITRLQLTGTTPDKRTIQLADKTTNRQIYDRAKEQLIIDFPTADKDGELANLNLKIYLDYTLTSGGTVTPKSTTVQQSYQPLKFVWAMPEQPPGCPASCDDSNPATQDACGPETNYFCEHRPVLGVCGNGICDGSKNSCTCPQDCGPCTGSTTYLSRSCIGTACAYQVKQGITVQQQSLFDDRNLGPFHLQNTYSFPKPFNAKKDAFTFAFILYSMQESVSSVTLKNARLLEGTQDVASAGIGQEFTAAGQNASITITLQPSVAEQERSLVLHVWYDYVQGGTTKQGEYTQALGKIPIVNPDV